MYNPNMNSNFIAEVITYDTNLFYKKIWVTLAYKKQLVITDINFKRIYKDKDNGADLKFTFKTFNILVLLHEKAYM